VCVYSYFVAQFSADILSLQFKPYGVVNAAALQSHCFSLSNSLILCIIKYFVLEKYRELPDEAGDGISVDPVTDYES
jgi:hypothetical protein